MKYLSKAILCLNLGLASTRLISTFPGDRIDLYLQLPPATIPTEQDVASAVREIVDTGHLHLLIERVPNPALLSRVALEQNNINECTPDHHKKRRLRLWKKKNTIWHRMHGLFQRWRLMRRLKKMRADRLRDHHARRKKLINVLNPSSWRAKRHMRTSKTVLEAAGKPLAVGDVDMGLVRDLISPQIFDVTGSKVKLGNIEVPAKDMSRYTGPEYRMQFVIVLKGSRHVTRPRRVVAATGMDTYQLRQKCRGESQESEGKREWELDVTEDAGNQLIVKLKLPTHLDAEATSTTLLLQHPEPSTGQTGGIWEISMEDKSQTAYVELAWTHPNDGGNSRLWLFAYTTPKARPKYQYTHASLILNADYGFPQTVYRTPHVSISPPDRDGDRSIVLIQFTTRD